MTETALIVYTGTGDNEPQKMALAVAAWLDAKERRSNSATTARTYRQLFASYAAYLHTHGHALDGDVAAVTTAAQAWAGRPSGRGGGPVSRVTYNHRLAVVSSFYTFAKKRGYVEHNPIDGVERARVQEYASSKALSFADVRSRLAAIDRSTLLGARDYALLMVALFTGRRASELSALTWGDIEGQHDGSWLVTWKRTKGGKLERNALPRAVTEALDEWVSLCSGRRDMPMVADSPVWRALSPRGTLTARPLSPRTLSLVCERRLGVSKVHSLRHTFAAAMEQSGAKVSEIQAALGHRSLQTTSVYLSALRTDENPYADRLAALYGLGEDVR